MLLTPSFGELYKAQLVDEVILPAVMAKLVGLDCGLNRLARRMKCTQCQGRRVTVRTVEPGER